LLLNHPTHGWTLFELGIGAFFSPKFRVRYGIHEQEHVLLNELKKHGLTHEDIKAVVLSHLHFDHAGGALSAYEEGKAPKLLFPNAKFYISLPQWERALNPHPRDRVSYIPELMEELRVIGNRLVLVDGPQTDLAPLVTFHFSDGHTPGLMHAEIQTDQGPVVFTSDLVPGIAWVHLAISTGYDRYPELLIDEKKRLYEDLLPRNGILFFTHETKHPFGRLHINHTTGRYETIPVDIN
jgi:glyoxylase-like metal-dependent hydrolase (beta-lactamase superfamily II)